MQDFSENSLSKEMYIKTNTELDEILKRAGEEYGQGMSFNAKAFPEFIKNIMASGGLVGYTESELKG